MNNTKSLLSQIQAVLEVLPVNKDDEVIVDALLSKRTASFKTRPLKKGQ